MVGKRKRLGDLIVEAGMITQEQLQHTLKTKNSGQKLGDALLESGLITEQDLIEVLEFQLGIPHINLSKIKIEDDVLKYIPKEMARSKYLIPLKKTSTSLQVAMNDPMDYFALDEIRLATGLKIEPVIATKDDIIQAINRYYKMQDTMDKFSKESLGDADDVTDEDSPAVQLVNHILTTAVQKKASDIHIDPQDKKVYVRFRIDGVLSTEGTLPKKAQSQLTARMKILANLNITETRLPQDGRIKQVIEGNPVDLRISTLPTVFGEKIVIRVLDLSSAMMELDKLGFNKLNHKRFLKLIEQPSGIILITGPTGSGKSSTLYAGLNHLNTEEVNIITVEDPVELQLQGINQVQVNSSVGLTFAAGLRSILRQDPNIVMVGEIRDAETAEIAIRASLTGHLVLSTLHTNSAIATIPRLIDMGIEPFMVVSALSGVLAQRLIRRVCSKCKQPAPLTEMEATLFKRRGIKPPEQIYKGKGCGYCNDSGYKGRVAIHELLVVDDEIKNMMLNNQSMTDIRKYCMKQGMIFLVDDGLLKVKQGLTTTEEVYRVAMDE